MNGLKTAKIKRRINGLNFTEREIDLIMMYREIEKITSKKAKNYSYFDIVYKTTQLVLDDLKTISKFPELDALKENVKKRMERKNE